MPVPFFVIVSEAKDLPAAERSFSRCRSFRMTAGMMVERGKENPGTVRTFTSIIKIKFPVQENDPYVKDPLSCGRLVMGKRFLFQEKTHPRR